MIWFAIETILLLSVVLTLVFKKTQLAFCLIGTMILIPSVMMGSFVATRIHLRLLPYVVFGLEQAQEDKIECTGYKDGLYSFSNGQNRREPNSLFLKVAFAIAFFIGSIIPFFAGLFVARKVTHKYAPEVYKMLRQNPIIEH